MKIISIKMRSLALSLAILMAPMTSFTHAREYLARVLPWPQDGDTAAYVNVHWTFKSANFTKPGWGGRACRSVSEAVKAVEFASKGVDTRDIYICMSTQTDAKEKVTPKGYKYLSPIRLQQNAVALKALFIDIDAKGKDKNSYDTISDAVVALAQFLTDTNMPKPSLVVTTGGGLHVYWTTCALTPDEWRPLAFALAEATKQHGLKCDTQVTIDSARLLRVPDTSNHKNKTPRPVRLTKSKTDFDYSIERLTSALTPYLVAVPRTMNGQAPVLSSLFPKRAALTAPSDLASGVETARFDPVDLASVVTECAFVRDALINGGKDYTNPLWNLTTLIAAFSNNGRANAHAMGQGHPGYTTESTDALYDRKERERVERNLGWPGCQTISASGCTACQSCKHLVAGKSPLNLATLVAVIAPPTTAPLLNLDMPDDHARRADNIIVRAVAGPAGAMQEVPVCLYPIYGPWMQRDPWILHFNSVTDLGKKVQVDLPLAECATKDGLKKNLWTQGLALKEAEMKQFGEFFVSWIHKLQQTKDMVVSSAPFGWNIKNGKIEGFCYGGNVWMPQGDRPAANSDFNIANQYMPTGEIEPWIAAAKIVTSQGMPALDAIIASAFGAPLVRFTGMLGLLMSCYSEASGVGKTTAMKVAQAVWGNPVKAIQGLSDTPLSVLNKIGELRSLPLYWDELKTEDDTRKFVNLTFQLSTGKEKSRLTKSIEQRNPGTWQTIMVSASNESLLDFIVSRTRMTTAGLYRVFEYDVPSYDPTKRLSLAKAQAAFSLLHENYGNVGLEYAKFLGTEFPTIDKEVTTFMDKLYNSVKGQSDERFWMGLITCVCMGARYSNKLGYTTIDETGLLKFMLETLREMRGHRTENTGDMTKVINISTVLGSYLNSMRSRHTLVTDRLHIGAGKPPVGSVKVVRDTSRLEAVYVHIGLANKLVRISSTHLSSWMEEAGYSRHQLTQALKREVGMKLTKARIGGGTQFVGTTEYLIEIDLAGTPLLNFIDEA